MATPEPSVPELSPLQTPRHDAAATDRDPDQVVSGPAAASPGRPSLGPAGAVIVIAALVYSWQVQSPGVWRDEGATVSACRRSLDQLFAMTQNVDLVHLGYYLLAHAVWQVEPSVTAVRVISVAGMSLSAGLLVLIGQRLGSQRLGVVAGLLLVVNPFASRYAQEARPYALVTMLATLATYLLLGLNSPARRAVNLIGYGVVLVLVGVGNILALLLLVPVHATYLVLTRSAQTRSARNRSAGTRSARTRERIVPWIVATGGALLVLLPFFLLTTTQSEQVDWIQPTHAYDLRALATLEFGSRIAPLIVALVVAALFGLRFRLRQSLVHREAFALGAAWALLPPVLLVTGSLVRPMWDAHYLVFTVPGLALMLAGLVPEIDARGLVRPLRLAACVLPVLLLGVLGLGVQQTYRERDGHNQNLTAVADYLTLHAEPGDAVVFAPAELRVLAQIRPELLGRLDDVAVVSPPVTSGTLAGIPVEPESALAALLPHRRIWVVHGRYEPDARLPASDRAVLAVLDRWYRPGRAEQITDVDVTLSVRRTD